MFRVPLANITGNIPCVCYIFGGIYLIELGYFKTGLFLLIVSASTIIHYRCKTGEEKNDQ